MRYLKYFLFLTSLLLFSGCASYRAAPLALLEPQFLQESTEADGLVIGCKEFSQKDCVTYLDRDVIKCGYRPIQLTFNNRTESSYFFSKAQVGLPCVAPSDVARLVHTSTVGRIVGYSVGALFLTPLLIPAIVDGIKSSKANEQLDQDFDAKALDHFVIAPQAFKTTIVFVPKESYSPVFDLTLTDQETGNPLTVKLIANK